MPRAFVLLLLSTLAIAACAAPAPDSATGAATMPGTPRTTAAIADQTVPPPSSEPAPPMPAPTSPPARRKPAPPMSDPLPPEQLPEPVKLDRSCSNDADCTVKDVGNCCGYYPQCVHKNSPTDPAGVQARCAQQGMASVCGFAEIEGCQCVRGQCAARTAGTATK